MSEDNVTFPSAGLKLSGNVHVPDGLKPGEKRGAFLVLHGFGSNKDSSNVLAPSKVLSELGYVTLRFSMRGCGDSADVPRWASCGRSQAYRGRRLELWRRGCGLYRGRR